MFTVLLFYFQIFGGVLVNISSLPEWIQWIQYLSLFRYTINVSCRTDACVCVNWGRPGGGISLVKMDHRFCSQYESRYKIIRLMKTTNHPGSDNCWGILFAKGATIFILECMKLKNPESQGYKCFHSSL